MVPYILSVECSESEQFRDLWYLGLLSIFLNLECFFLGSRNGDRFYSHRIIFGRKNIYLDIGLFKKVYCGINKQNSVVYVLVLFLSMTG